MHNRKEVFISLFRFSAGSTYGLCFRELQPYFCRCQLEIDATLIVFRLVVFLQTATVANHFGFRTGPPESFNRVVQICLFLLVDSKEAV